MTKKILFGTDGIRGTANIPPLDPASAVKAGIAIAEYFKLQCRTHKCKAVIGMDPRISSEMLSDSVSAGIRSAGCDVLVLGTVSTPLVSSFVTDSGADFGIVISASHNPFEDNGIKVFNGKGTKLNDDEELEIERIYFSGGSEKNITGGSLGKASIIENPDSAYVSRIVSVFGPKIQSGGIKASIDLANGATYLTAQRVFNTLLKKNVKYYSFEPDGININDGCGALHPEQLGAKVRNDGSDIGIAFDGDGDRFIAVDETGAVIDGDRIIGICARHLKNNGRLKKDTVVTTVMSNAGLERYLLEKGIKMSRTPVGDRYVFEEMSKSGAVLGGENSGHIIFSDINPTGDGIVAALTVLEIMSAEGKKLSELAKEIPLFPQFLSKVKVEKKTPLEDIPGLAALIKENEAGLEGGRMLVRYSGTEPVLRIMAEGPDISKVKDSVESVAAFIKGLK